jgi:Na+-translocating ferredoxin:NAD+ oxidoreductase RNF subunit RnfB
VNLGTVLLASAILGGLGLTFGLLIAVVHHRFYVFEDPRIDALSGLLPGTNCGACGHAGCRAFAEALISHTVEPVQCTVMGADDVQHVADYLGVEAGAADKRVARLLCAGGCDVAPRTGEYRGLDTCAAAAAVAGGGKSCTWGCLGLADCEVACDLDAIFMNDEELPVVVPELCTACGDCVDACPKDLFTIMPMEQKLIVQCKNLLHGARAEDVCLVACNGCGKCVMDAEPGLIEMVQGLAVVDYQKNTLASPDAIRRCPTGAIVWVDGPQFTSPTPEAAEEMFV